MKNKLFVITLILAAIVLIAFMYGCTSTSSTSATTTTTTTSTSSTSTPASTTSTSSASTTSTTSTSTTSTTTAVAEGLVAHYTFDESSGTTASDSSGNSLDGTVYGGASWETGRIGNALSFDGINDWVGVPASGEAAPSEINNLAVGSVSLWIKYDGEAPLLYPIMYVGASPEVSDTNEGVLIEMGHSEIPDLTNSEDLFYTVTMAGSAEPIFCYDSNVHITPEVWNHFVVTVGTNENTGYLNGEEITNRYYNFGDADDSYFYSAVTGNIMSIGYGRFAFTTPGLFFYYKGLIDDIRIYNRVLSSAEVTELYNQ